MTTPYRPDPLQVLKNVQAALQHANELPNGPINDTIWYSDHETLFDYIAAAIDVHSNDSQAGAESYPPGDDDDSREDEISDFREGQWWFEELQKIANAPDRKLAVTDDMIRAVFVVRRLLRMITALRACGAVPSGWTDDQVIRFGGWLVIARPHASDSIQLCLEKFRECETERGIAAPAAPMSAQGQVAIDMLSELIAHKGTDSDIWQRAKHALAKARGEA